MTNKSFQKKSNYYIDCNNIQKKTKHNKFANLDFIVYLRLINN